MTVATLKSTLNLEAAAMADGERVIEGAYCGDLLSWVMGRAKANQVWITIMTNINVLAVASLVDFSCVIIAEGARLSPEDTDEANQKGINVLYSDMPVFEIAAALSKLI